MNICLYVMPCRWYQQQNYHVQLGMRRTFAESFEQELLIEEEIAKKWGYSLPTSELCTMKSTEKAQKNLFVNRFIVPRQINKIKVQSSWKHKELIKEISDNEYEKKMKQRSSKHNEQFDTTKMLNERIKQYNYLIDHKHIKNKNSQDTKRVMKAKPKTQAQIILEEINATNSQLTKVEDLDNQFKLNKKITKLYREYKDKMYEDSAYETERRVSFSQTQTISATNKNKIRNGSFAQAKNKTVSTKNVINREQSPSAKNFQFLNIEEPFVSKDFILKSKDLERKFQNHEEKLEHYKFKVNKAKIQSFERCQGHKKTKKSKTASEKFVTPNSRPISDEISAPKGGLIIEESQRKQSADYSAINIIKEKRNLQQKYFSTFLDKRNRKFKKPWGNKILIKYDSHSQARQMLEGRSGTASPQRTGQQFFPNATQKINSFRIIPKELSSDDRAVLENMMEEEADEKIYETMCKNEKINLFLKARKIVD